ncbi:hypothetical protein BJP24_22055 [Aeromonas allosaccharophila]|nr:hypothetical protein BJP24_22055 [Aeromonas allosaccharophila]
MKFAIWFVSTPLRFWLLALLLLPPLPLLLVLWMLPPLPPLKKASSLTLVLPPVQALRLWP